MILRNRIFISVIFVLFFFTFSFSQQKLTADEIAAKVQAKYSAQADISANFTQKTMLRFSKTEQLQNGTIKIKKGNKFCVETPQQMLISNGKTIWMYTPSTSQVIISTYKKNSTSFSVDQFLYGLPKDFSVSLDTLLGNEAILKLFPKSAKNKSVTELTAWIDVTEWTIRKIEYVDFNKTRTSVELNEIRFNSGFTENDFVFTIPAGATVVDTRTAQQ